MKLKGWGHMQMLKHTVQNRLGARGLILLYHRISNNPLDPQRLAVSPENFSAQLQVLCQATQPIPLDELHHRLKTRTRHDRPLSVVTFDDGYADNLEQAAPILARHSVPATVFVATAALNPHYEFYWDALARVLLRPGLPPRLSLNIGGTSHTWIFPEGSNGPESWNVKEPPSHTAHHAYLQITEMMMYLPQAEREDVLSQLFGRFGISRKPSQENRTLSEDELHHLTSSGLITAGAHSENHPVLSNLPRGQQALEIWESRDRLARIVGQPVNAFSYPYGRIQDYSPQTVQLIQSGGFTCACSNFPRLANRWTDPFQLPRFIADDIDGKLFEKKMESFLRHYC